MNDKIMQNVVSMLKDVMHGDYSVLEREDYQGITGVEIREATNLIVNNNLLSREEQNYWLNNIWKINYHHKPPTVEEYLTPAWLGEVGDTIYDHVKDDICTFLNPISNKRVLALSCAIGYGKSFLSALIAIYIVIHLSYMRDPKKFFGLNKAGSFAVVLMSFTKEKVGQILLQPFANILHSSPIFDRTLREDKLEYKQEHIDPWHIAYTTAGRMGAFQFTQDIHITTISNRAQLLGLNIIFGIASEISFWIKKGISVEEIWGSFTDLRERVNSRFHSRYLTGVVLDSSPLDLSLSPIDRWLYTGEAKKDPEVMIVNKKHWEVFPERYPQWRKTGKTFPVFRGTSAKAPKIIKDDVELSNYDKQDIIDVPIDKLNSFKSNLKKQIADYAAWPAGGLSKVIEEKSILENCFTSQLSNIYDYVYAPSSSPPEHLIWNQIRDQFFIEVKKDYYQFYRAPMALRTIHVDLSEKNDVSGIAMTHFENNEKGDSLIIVDFAFGISPQEHTINLDAVAEFIIDLKKIGNIRIFKATADQWQSVSLIQRLKREGIKSEKLSVDKDMSPYRLIVSWMQNERLKLGYSILVKNNFLSLIEITSDKGHTKIDHTKGDIVYNDGGDWDVSFMGTNAKDVSDALTGAGFTLVTEVSEKPKYVWKDEAYLYEEISIENNKEEENTITIRKDILENVKNKFGLVVHGTT